MSNLEINRRQGQATVEFAILLPLFVMVAAMVIFVSYVCWQGVKTQQAANLAARIQGQERVGGGVSSSQIDQLNGVQAGANTTAPGQTIFTGSVYATYNTKIHTLFGIQDVQLLRSQPPIIRYGSDEVHVVRTITFPPVMFLTGRTITLDAYAYGGEDSYMFGLPRWGSPSGPSGGEKYWQWLMKQVAADPSISSNQYK